MNNSNNGLNINGFAIHQMTCQVLTVDNILYLEELYKHLIIIIIIFFFCLYYWDSSKTLV